MHQKALPWTKGLEALEEKLVRPVEWVLSRTLTFNMDGKTCPLTRIYGWTHPGPHPFEDKKTLDGLMRERAAVLPPKSQPEPLGPMLSTPILRSAPEAKGTGYNQHYDADGELKDLWWQGTQGWQQQMDNQVRGAANGLKIEWHIAEDANNGFIEAVKKYILFKEYVGRVVVVVEKP